LLVALHSGTISYEKPFEIYIQTGFLEYLLTLKTSQDHVEHLFCCIRESLYKNNYPSTNEFTTGLKKIVLEASHHSQYQYPMGQRGGAVGENFKFF
jgi:hypothetical protein